jgi:mannose-6-phosphate isomerase-like protein (cupin superfamily)
MGKAGKDKTTCSRLANGISAVVARAVELYLSKRMIRITQLDSIPAVPCPCGEARRAFADPENTLATVHLTDISKDSRAHYHKRMTEIYVVLEGEGVLEADGKVYPLKPLTAVMIPPGCIHRAVGNLRILNIPMPPFDPSDEFEVTDHDK